MKSILEQLGEGGSRRDFLRGRVSLSAATAATAVSAALAAARAAAASTDTTDELIFMSATKLAQQIRAKKISAVEAVEAFIARQLDINDEMNAVVMNCYARARKEAKALDDKAARGEWVGALHGVPMTIKDSLDAEGVISTGATYGRQQYIPTKDATVVARVRKAGAILLGKTNTPEFTLGGGARETYNLLFGQTYNPYNTAYLCSGSSGGAGAGYGGMTSEYNTTGWPAGVVRAGTSKDEPGLPLGIMAVAQPWRDDVVLAALSFIEGKTGGWQKPPI
jgi:amidase